MAKLTTRAYTQPRVGERPQQRQAQEERGRPHRRRAQGEEVCVCVFGATHASSASFCLECGGNVPSCLTVFEENSGCCGGCCCPTSQYSIGTLPVFRRQVFRFISCFSGQRSGAADPTLVRTPTVLLFFAAATTATTHRTEFNPYLPPTPHRTARSKPPKKYQIDNQGCLCGVT